MAQMIVTRTRPAYQAYQLLYLGFIVAPLVAGLDKFTHVLTDWDKYLAPVVAGLLPFSAHTFMLFVGIVEIGAAVTRGPASANWRVRRGGLASRHRHQSPADSRVLRRRPPRFRTHARCAGACTTQ